jgi:hypothetical protein
MGVATMRPTNSLLAAGNEAQWARLADEKRTLRHRAGQTVEERLLRGQRLSAQAAALRRAVERDEPVRPGP